MLISEVIAKYIKTKYKKRVIFIPYGADKSTPSDNDRVILSKYQLKPDAYFLQACRLEPENNAQLVIGEYTNYKGNKDLVIVGDTKHSLPYKQYLKKIANGQVKFLGGIYNEDFKVILRNAYCYIQGHEAGGTNPVSLEAMASARCPLVLNVPYNIAVIKDCGISFSKSKGDLKSKLELVEKNTHLVKELGWRAFQKAQTEYAWSKIISAYDQIFASLSR